MMYPSLFWSISNVKSNINHLYETTDCVDGDEEENIRLE
jgi:hypothetical protein